MVCSELEKVEVSIRTQLYAKPYAADRRKVIALGINFSSEKGTIDGFQAE